MGSSLEPFVIDAAVTVVTVTVWRLSLPAAGGQVAFSWLSSHGLRADPFYHFMTRAVRRAASLYYSALSTPLVILNQTMLLTRLRGSQAPLPLLFFSPSAAAFFRGTPDPTLGFPSRPAGRRPPARAPAGPGPGLGPGSLQLGDVPGFFRSGDAWWRGPGRDAPKHIFRVSRTLLRPIALYCALLRIARARA